MAPEARVAEGAAIASYYWGGRAHDCTNTYMTIGIGYILLLNGRALGDVLAVDCFAATDRIIIYKPDYCSTYCCFYYSNQTRDTGGDAAMPLLSLPASALAPLPS